MKTETYTPGHSANATDFMAKRSFESHGAFFSSYLRSGMRVLDCGCGPGSITLGMAQHVSPGEVVGVDFGPSQIEQAKRDAVARGIDNVRFVATSCYELPLADESFDGVFSHALFEHLAEPGRALAEIRRVLKPAGVVGLCSPDWGGFVLAPPSAELNAAVEAYTALQTKNRGDVMAGRKLGVYLAEAGFRSIQLSARYECYPSLPLIGDYLALQLQQAGFEKEAATLKTWSRSEAGLFAQAWVSAVAKK